MNHDNFLIGEGPDKEKRILLLPYFEGEPREVKYHLTLPEPGLYKIYIGDFRKSVGEIKVT